MVECVDNISTPEKLMLVIARTSWLNQVLADARVDERLTFGKKLHMIVP